MAVEECLCQVGMSISSTFWKNTSRGNDILPANNIMRHL